MRTPIATRLISVAFAATLGAVASSAPALAADHLEAPVISLDGRQDLADVYAFQSPTDPNNAVLIFTVNPAAGMISPTTLDPNAVYELLIDTDGDFQEDIVYRLQAQEPAADGSQAYAIQRRERVGVVWKSRLVAAGQAGNVIPVGRDGLALLDVFDDPFFFDLNALQNGFAFTVPGTDFFAGLNVTALVLEVPRDELGVDTVRVWARTSIDGNQYDRTALPAINTVLIPSGLKDRFNLGVPMSDQRDYRATLIATLTDVLGNDEATANALADVLLPDVLTFDTTNPAGFLNGRRPEDDVIDAELALLTGGAITTDGVDANDVPFPGAFPHLAPAN